MMNIRNNKGITFMSLIVTIIILLMLSGVAISISFDITKTADFENVQTNLLLIQSKCKIMAEKYAIGDIKEEDLYGTKQTEGKYKDWYLLSAEDLYSMGLEKLNAEDNYYVDYTNDNVAYGKGITYEETTFYELSNILEYVENSGEEQ